MDIVKKRNVIYRCIKLYTSTKILTSTKYNAHNAYCSLYITLGKLYIYI